jgi:hypothetical protein
MSGHRYVTRVLLYVVVVAAVAALAPASPADDVDPRFSRYLASSDYVDALNKQAVAADRLHQGGCGEPKALRHALAHVFEPPRFAALSDGPISGVWKERVEIDRCGPKVVENLLVIVDKGATKFIRLLPGNTRTDPLLQRDALQAALAAAIVKRDQQVKAGGPPCSDKEGAAVSDTRVLRERVPIANDGSGKMTAGAWDESWTFLFCGREIAVRLQFDADGKGGTNFTAKPQE